MTDKILVTHADESKLRAKQQRCKIKNILILKSLFFMDCSTLCNQIKGVGTNANLKSLAR